MLLRLSHCIPHTRMKMLESNLHPITMIIAPASPVVHAELSCAETLLAVLLTKRPMFGHVQDKWHFLFHSH
jgi:hypothetical protein